MIVLIAMHSLRQHSMSAGLTQFHHVLLLLFIAPIFLLLGSCTPTTKMLVQGGERPATGEEHPPSSGPHVLIFGFDGAGYDQLMAAIKSGNAPNLSGLLGADLGNGIYEHAYSAPEAISILPSTTM